MTKIKNIIFDLSEVLIAGLIGVENTLSEQLLIEKNLITKALGSNTYYTIGNQLEQLCTGTMNLRQYLDFIHKELNLKDNYDDIFNNAFHTCFTNKYHYSEKLINSLQNNYELFLFTDHCKEWIKDILQEHPFLHNFKQKFYSFDIGYTKRDIRSFEYLIHLHGIKPNESLFIDDSLANILNAKQLGFNVIHFQKEASINDIYNVLEINPVVSTESRINSSN